MSYDVTGLPEMLRDCYGFLWCNLLMLRVLRVLRVSARVCACNTQGNCTRELSRAHVCKPVTPVTIITLSIYESLTRNSTRNICLQPVTPDGLVLFYGEEITGKVA